MRSIRALRCGIGRWLVVGATTAIVALVLASPALAAVPAASAPNWKVYDYNRSGQAFRSRVPDRLADGVAQFTFLDTPDTALLTTDHPSYRGDLLGNMDGKTLSATVAIAAGSGVLFHYYGEPSCGSAGSDPPANVRFFFQTNTSGKFQETDYWWSNPVHARLEDLVGSPTTITEAISEGSRWSDFYGHFGNDAAYSAAFQAAVRDVQSIGLSFGGGCFFENGVGVSGGSATFQLQDFSAS